MTKQHAPHDGCWRPGKFDCETDETVRDSCLETSVFEGDQSSPVGWFQEVDLEKTDPAATHYKSTFLIARELPSGIFFTEAYATKTARNDRLESLRKAHEEWESQI